VVDGTIDPRSRGRNSVIGTIHGRPRPPIFGGPGTEHLSEYSGVLTECCLLARVQVRAKPGSTLILIDSKELWGGLKY
jgi:hypothetical protein